MCFELLLLLIKLHNIVPLGQNCKGEHALAMDVAAVYCLSCEIHVFWNFEKC